MVVYSLASVHLLLQTQLRHGEGVLFGQGKEFFWQSKMSLKFWLLIRQSKSIHCPSFKVCMGYGLHCTVQQQFL